MPRGVYTRQEEAKVKAKAKAPKAKAKVKDVADEIKSVIKEDAKQADNGRLGEYPLLLNEERMVIDRSLIDQVALPIGDQYEDDLFQHYFADYAGMARKYAPRRIFEVGVRYGYIAMCLCTGAREGLSARGIFDPVYYRGIDDESYHANSCSKANDNFRIAIPWADAQALKWNSFDEWPRLGGFDFIHIDGNHDYHGVWNDLHKAWPILNPNGFILLDDATNETPIWKAIEDFLASLQRGPDLIRWQYQSNERNHAYIQKVVKNEDE